MNIADEIAALPGKPSEINITDPWSYHAKVVEYYDWRLSVAERLLRDIVGTDEDEQLHPTRAELRLLCVHEDELENVRLYLAHREAET
jgi:hypothetical protein